MRMTVDSSGICLATAPSSSRKHRTTATATVPAVKSAASHKKCADSSVARLHPRDCAGSGEDATATAKCMPTKCMPAPRSLAPPAPPPAPTPADMMPPMQMMPMGTHRTLDLEHMGVMRKLTRDRQTAAALRAEAAVLRQRLDEIQSRPSSQLSDADFAELQLKSERYGQVTDRAADVEDHSDEMAYFVRTADILFRYYDIIDKGHDAAPLGSCKCPTVQAAAATQEHAPAPATATATATLDPAAPAAPAAPAHATAPRALQAQQQPQPQKVAKQDASAKAAKKDFSSVLSYFTVRSHAGAGAGGAGAGAGAGFGGAGEVTAISVSVDTEAKAEAEAEADAAPTTATVAVAVAAAVTVAVSLATSGAVGAVGAVGETAAATAPARARAVPTSTAGAGGAAATPSRLQGIDDRASLLELYMRQAHTDRAPPAPNERERDRRANAHGGGGGGGGRGAGSVGSAASAAMASACGHCGSCDRTVQLQDGCVFCNRCFTVEYILIDHEKPSYKDPPKEVSYFAYKRINHLNEWLNQVQGKETTEIPEEVYDAILLEIKKQKRYNMATLTHDCVRQILKKLRLNRYYEHCPHIINRLNGRPIPNLPQELEDRLRHMFCQIQVPFLKHAPPTRKNFLSYSFCLHKLMQLLEQDQYLGSFKLLKSREKLFAQDRIWKKICEELGWDFIPSL
jgi:hypothetical protein